MDAGSDQAGNKTEIATEITPGADQEVAKEIVPAEDQEIATEFPYNAPQKGMNKKQHQQSKE